MSTADGPGLDPAQAANFVMRVARLRMDGRMP